MLHREKRKLINLLADCYFQKLREEHDMGMAFDFTIGMYTGIVEVFKTLKLPVPLPEGKFERRQRGFSPYLKAGVSAAQTY